jgi:predicted transcriptional regulator
MPADRMGGVGKSFMAEAISTLKRKLRVKDIKMRGRKKRR